MINKFDHEPVTPQPSEKLFEGSWSDTISWSFFLSGKIPPRELCTAVSCVAILELNDEMPKIILVKNKRGWEEIGGHIEKGETAAESITREALEEGGFQIDHMKPFGFKQIVATIPSAHEQADGHYPFPVSFQPYFLAVGSKATVTVAADGDEILDSRSFDLDKMPEEITTLNIIRAGIQVYRNELIIPE